MNSPADRVIAALRKETASGETEAGEEKSTSAEIVSTDQKIGNPPVWGASPEEWIHFDVVMGLGEDMLPVVSNPAAETSPTSTLKAIGKTPSQYNGARKVVGIPSWTSHRADAAELERWAAEPDYGICLQTRTVRALDIDVPDVTRAQDIARFVAAHLGTDLPSRGRSNSGKSLLAFRMPGDTGKRTMQVDGGIVEFLATGQQFVAAGTHPSGSRYEWAGGLPFEFPELTLDVFEALWAALGKRFAVAPPTGGTVSVRQKGDRIDTPDPVADHLHAQGLVLGESRDGALWVACPWESEHSGGTPGDTSTAWFVAGTNGYNRGNFKCLHAHCEGRAREEFLAAVGYDDGVLDDFEVIGQKESANATRADEARISFVDFGSLAFGDPPPRRWIVQEWVPRGSVTALFGRGGHGKSLLAQQMAVAVSNGLGFIGITTERCPVLGLFCEDDTDELLRRGSALFGAFMVGVDESSGQMFLDARAGKFNTLISFRPDRMAVPTALMAELRKRCAELLPGLVILDNIAQIFAGQENVRAEVTSFCNELTGIARTFDCAVLLLGHTAKTDGSEYSGSTAWNAAVRSRLFIERQEDGTTVLKKSKANYAALDEVRVEYRNGAFFRLQTGGDANPTMVDAMKPAIADAVRVFTSRQQSTSHLPTARNYLIKVMKDEQMLGGVSETVARSAMRAMVDSGELIPNSTLAWKTSSRHPVQGLAVRQG